MAISVVTFLLGFLWVQQASAACGTINPTPRIINGIPAMPCSNPWHVHVHYLENGVDIANPDTTVSNMACSGVIIDSSHVIISPTCIFLFNTNVSMAMENMVLSAGDTDIDVAEGTEQYRRPTAAFFHPLYPFRTQFDLLTAVDDTSSFFWFQDGQAVIMRVEPSFDLANCVNEICLPEPNLNECTFTNCVLSANGWLSRDPLVRSTQTQIATMTTLPARAGKVLADLLEGFRLPVDGFSARAESSAYPCVNDAGGPLACADNGVFFLRGTSVSDFCNPLAPPLFWDASSETSLTFISDVLAYLETPFLEMTHS